MGFVGAMDFETGVQTPLDTLPSPMTFSIFMSICFSFVIEVELSYRVFNVSGRRSPRANKFPLQVITNAMCLRFER